MKRALIPMVVAFLLGMVTAAFPHPETCITTTESVCRDIIEERCDYTTREICDEDGCFTEEVENCRSVAIPDCVDEPVERCSHDDSEHN